MSFHGTLDKKMTNVSNSHKQFSFDNNGKNMSNRIKSSNYNTNACISFKKKKQTDDAPAQIKKTKKLQGLTQNLLLAAGENRLLKLDDVPHSKKKARNPSCFNCCVRPTLKKMVDEIKTQQEALLNDLPEDIADDVKKLFICREELRDALLNGHQFAAAFAKRAKKQACRRKKTFMYAEELQHFLNQEIELIEIAFNECSKINVILSKLRNEDVPPANLLLILHCLSQDGVDLALSDDNITHHKTRGKLHYGFKSMLKNLKTDNSTTTCQGDGTLHVTFGSKKPKTVVFLPDDPPTQGDDQRNNNNLNAFTSCIYKEVDKLISTTNCIYEYVLEQTGWPPKFFTWNEDSFISPKEPVSSFSNHRLENPKTKSIESLTIISKTNMSLRHEDPDTSLNTVGDYGTMCDQRTSTNDTIIDSGICEGSMCLASIAVNQSEIDNLMKEKVECETHDIGRIKHSSSPIDCSQEFTSISPINSNSDKINDKYEQRDVEELDDTRSCEDDLSYVDSLLVEPVSIYSTGDGKSLNTTKNQNSETMSSMSINTKLAAAKIVAELFGMSSKVSVVSDEGHKIPSLKVKENDKVCHLKNYKKMTKLFRCGKQLIDGMDNLSKMQSSMVERMNYLEFMVRDILNLKLDIVT